MELYNELNLRFEQTIWALYPELALFDAILKKRGNLWGLLKKMS